VGKRMRVVGEMAGVDAEDKCQWRIVRERR
jgi:hypothetical protein